jgi:2-polyprenyl-6-hydroxyphenyl methylase/3-demethylubiquinone-9 3-methyltransferase
VGAEYIFNWIPRGTHDWTKYLTPQEIITLLLQQKENSMHVVDVTGMYYNPLLGTWNETSNLTVNYILCATKQTINK